MVDDPEYQRLISLRRDAAARGHHLAAIAYGQAALVRGDDLIAELGGTQRFAPLTEPLARIAGSLK